MTSDINGATAESYRAAIQLCLQCLDNDWDAVAASLNELLHAGPMTTIAVLGPAWVTADMFREKYGTDTARAALRFALDADPIEHNWGRGNAQ